MKNEIRIKKKGLDYNPMPVPLKINHRRRKLSELKELDLGLQHDVANSLILKENRDQMMNFL